MNEILVPEFRHLAELRFSQVCPAFVQLYLTRSEGVGDRQAPLDSKAPHGALANSQTGLTSSLLRFVRSSSLSRLPLLKLVLQPAQQRLG